MTLVTPERWYIVFWIAMGGVALAPLYYGVWRIVRAVETVEFILSVSRK